MKTFSYGLWERNTHQETSFTLKNTINSLSKSSSVNNHRSEISVRHMTLHLTWAHSHGQSIKNLKSRNCLQKAQRKSIAFQLMLIQRLSTNQATLHVWGRSMSGSVVMFLRQIGAISIFLTVILDISHGNYWTVCHMRSLKRNPRKTKSKKSQKLIYSKGCTKSLSK